MNTGRDYCPARLRDFDGWSGVYPRCAQPPGHDGNHTTSYGLEFNNKGETIR